MGRGASSGGGCIACRRESLTKTTRVVAKDSGYDGILTRMAVGSIPPEPVFFELDSLLPPVWPFPIAVSLFGVSMFLLYQAAAFFKVATREETDAPKAQ